jgi:hypothetical protein
LIPRSASYTTPIQGAFFYGATIYLGTDIISLISAFVSNDYGTCIFISSPSKSALYGVVTLKFKRNV